MSRFVFLSLAIALFAAGNLSAADVKVTGGQTSVFLDPQVLGSLDLSVSGVTDDVMVPGSLPDSVGFGINPRDAVAPALPTTFEYDSSDFLNTFMGTLEHTGSVFIEDPDGVQTQVGNLTIGFDANRIVDDASGFFVTSNIGLTGPLFDLEATSLLDPRPDGLTAEARLLVAPELATVLGSDSLAGITIGSARIEAVPEPASVVTALIGGAIAMLSCRRRRVAS